LRGGSEHHRAMRHSPVHDDYGPNDPTHDHGPHNHNNPTHDHSAHDHSAHDHSAHNHNNPNKDHHSPHNHVGWHGPPPTAAGHSVQMTDNP
jgi:hypothetical protein